MSHRILIIDDDEHICNIVRITLEAQGYEVKAELEGNTGLQRALNEEFQVIILDIMLPEKDGWEICKEIRNSPMRDVPIIMLTAKTEEVDRVLGLELGADVPVFVRGSAAWAEGVGERLTPVEPDCPWFVVLVPDVVVATGAVFQAPELTRNSPPIRMSAFRAGGGRNDCTAAVRARYPAVAAALDALGAFGPARLTGTGGCVFLACPTRSAARSALRACRAAGWRGFVARGLNRSPLSDRLRQLEAGGPVATGV